MIRTICVYCSSSNLLEECYYDVARSLGRLMASNGYRLVYGGGSVGLMGELAREVHRHHGVVMGVIPRSLKNREGVAYDIADELIVTETLRERKAIMYERADAFIALPGGLGTLEELMEVLTLKQLGYHRRPIVIVNAHGFYTPFFDLLQHFHARRFVSDTYTSLFHAAPSVSDAMAYLGRIDGLLPTETAPASG